MPGHLLRIETVNLGDCVFDTSDLASTRGGGLLALDAPDWLQDKSFAGVEFNKDTRLMSGASQGLFKLPEANAETAGQVRDEVERELLADPANRFLTFSVDVIPAVDDDGKGEESRAGEIQSLIALNRWRQLQQPTVSVPEWVDDVATVDSAIQSMQAVAEKDELTIDRPLNPHGEPCRIDRLRPALDCRPNPEQKLEAVSESVRARSDYGRDRKQNFYASVLERASHENAWPGKDRFVYDFSELTSRANNWSREEDAAPVASDPRRKTHHKMAVLYFDGNAFGETQSRLDRQSLCEFSQQLRGYQDAYLVSLLETMQREAPEGGQQFSPRAADWFWWSRKDRERRFRIETLLWGGDEVILVLPAWQGWRVVESFFAASADWKFQRQRQPAVPLTHSGGIVFCHHNAPISRIKSLCGELAELCKTRDRGRNQFAYEVLESFDTIEDAERRRLRRLPPKDGEENSGDPLILDGDQSTLHDIGRLICVLREHAHRDEVSRRKLHAVVQARSQPGWDAKDSAWNNAVAQLESGLQSLQIDVPKTTSRECLWSHVLELWDYVWYPDPDPSAGGAE